MAKFDVNEVRRDFLPAEKHCELHDSMWGCIIFSQVGDQVVVKQLWCKPLRSPFKRELARGERS